MSARERRWWMFWELGPRWWLCCWRPKPDGGYRMGFTSYPRRTEVEASRLKADYEAVDKGGHYVVVRRWLQPMDKDVAR